MSLRGKQRIKWAAREMPVLSSLVERFIKTKPFLGVRISACLHVTAETANLMLALKSGGAQVALCGSNPLSTQDDVVQSLKHDYKIPVFAKRGVKTRQYYQHLKQALAHKPQLTVDDGADLVTFLHTKSRRLLKDVWGGTEETTTGVIRLKTMAKLGKLRYPIIAVNSALTKYLFDNRYGTGQSTLDAIMRATNILLAGKVFVVAGYGWCGKGVAMRAKGLGARVVVVEVDAVRALEAVMDGFEILPMMMAARIGDIFVTTTGDVDVITKPYFLNMKSGAIVANSGHFDVEVNVKELEKLTTKVTVARDNVREYTLKNGRKIYLLAEGRLVNLGAAEGHPASVMDLSFSNQALALEYLVKQHAGLTPAVYPVPSIIDNLVAELKLRSMKVSHDTLSPKQKKYLTSWKIGT